MDYKELIERLKDENTSHAAYESQRLSTVLKDARIAIENLMEERDAAIRMLQGKCSACKYENRWRDELPCCNCYYNKTYKFKGVKKEDNWEWRGITQSD